VDNKDADPESKSKLIFTTNLPKIKDWRWISAHSMCNKVAFEWPSSPTRP
jgi:hypothetical protein